jgi:hypothetical protein
MGFVANSSSSSFICCQCSELAGGWDKEPSDFDMLECTNDHTFCVRHFSIDEIKDLVTKVAIYNNIASDVISNALDYINEDYVSNYSILNVIMKTLNCYFVIPEHLCPYCNGDKASDMDVMHLIKTTDPKYYEDMRQKLMVEHKRKFGRD